jgi:hypothetical protein
MMWKNPARPLTARRGAGIAAVMPRSLRPRTLPRWILAALLAGLGTGVACKDGGSNSPGGGGGACPGALPRNGASCPRGEADFCVYRGGGKGDHVCTCGKGGWRCAKK